MEELDVTSAWILSNFITISTMTMNMKWTCPEKTISLPPSQAITPLFPTRTVVKIRHSHSMIIFFFFLSPSFSFSSWSVPESSGYFQGGDWRGPLGGTAMDSGGRGFWGSTLVWERRLSRLMGQPTPPNKDTDTDTDTHTHTHTELEGGFIWNEQTDCQVRLWTSEAFQSAGCIPCVLRSEGRIWPQN